MDANSIALAGDDRFLDRLVEQSNQDGRLSGESHQSLACKLAERRVYRPLMVVPGDRVSHLLENLNSQENSEQTLRQFAAIVDSPFFSPLLLLIAGAVEKLLAHAIDSEADFDALLTEIAARPDRLESPRFDS